MSKNGTKFPLDCPFKGNRHFLSHNIDDRFSALIFTELNPNPHLHLESAFGMQIPDADPGDQNHADSCGCGSATLSATMHRGNDGVNRVSLCKGKDPT
jgi:hypothetical protein